MSKYFHYLIIFGVLILFVVFYFVLAVPHQNKNNPSVQSAHPTKDILIISPTPTPQNISINYQTQSINKCDYSQFQNRISELEKQLAQKDVIINSLQQKISNQEKTINTLINTFNKDLNYFAYILTNSDYKNSVLNLFTNNIVPSQPMYYSQDLIDLSKKIIFRTLMAASEVICRDLERYKDVIPLPEMGDQCKFVINVGNQINQ